MKTLYRAHAIHTRSHPETGDWILIDDRHVQRVGSGDPPNADRIVDLPGSTIVPGFVDAHVHLTSTGLRLSNDDVAAAGGKQELLAVARERASVPGPTLLIGYDESWWASPEVPSLEELDEVSAEPLAIRRADGHVCLANSAAIAAAEVSGASGLELDPQGEPTGKVKHEANDVMRRWFALAVTDNEVQQLQLQAAALAASRGVTLVHEMSMPAEMGLRDLQVLLAHRDRLPVDTVVHAATMDVPQVMDLGLDAVGGDLPADGSIGARTAALAENYVDAGHAGSPYYPTERLVDFFHAGHSAGLQVGMHAIGDLAIDQVLTAWESVYATLDSRERRHFRARRHRIEHFEVLGPDHLERTATLGLAVSVQPAFDDLWGAPGGLYDASLGWDRASTMNPFRSILDRGIAMGAGSDSPITPLDPMLWIQAMQNHHDPDQRLTRTDAIRASTIGGARLARLEGKKGLLEPGMHADFAAYEEDPFTAESLEGLRPILTVSYGREVFAG